MSIKPNLIFLYVFFISSKLYSSIPNNFFISSRKVSKFEKIITIKIIIPSQDFFYKDYFHFSVDSPYVTISNWKSTAQAQTIYDPVFKETKQIFNKNFKITITATALNILDEKINLHGTYYQRSEKRIKQFLWRFSFKEPQSIKKGKNTEEIPPKENRLAEELSAGNYLSNYIHNFKNSLLHYIPFICIIVLSILLCVHSKYYGVIENESESVLSIFLSIILHQFGIILALFSLGFIILINRHYFPSYNVMNENLLSFMCISAVFILSKINKGVTLNIKKNNIVPDKLVPYHCFTQGIKTGFINSLGIIPLILMLFNSLKTIRIISFFWSILCIGIGITVSNLFMQKNHQNRLLQDFLKISICLTTLSFFVLSLYYMQIIYKPAILSLGLGILFFYFGSRFISISSELKFFNLRSFTSIFGSILIIISIYLLFVAIQKIDLIYFSQL